MKKTFLISLLFLLLISCSNKESSNTSEKMEKGVYPDIILKNAQYSVSQEDGDEIVLNSSNMIFYSADDYALLENLAFSTEGEKRITGRANKAKLNLSDNFLEMEGDVFFKSDDGLSINAESVHFDSEKNMIYSSGCVEVASNNTSLSGYDFTGDLSNETYSFKRIEKGELKIE